MTDFTELENKYEFLSRKILDNYMESYKNKYPGRRDIDTANKFMNEQYEHYRTEIANITMDLIHDSGMDKEFAMRLFGRNKYAIGALFSEIMLDSF